MNVRQVAYIPHSSAISTGKPTRVLRGKSLHKRLRVISTSQHPANRSSSCTTSAGQAAPLFPSQRELKQSTIRPFSTEVQNMRMVGKRAKVDDNQVAEGRPALVP